MRVLIKNAKLLEAKKETIKNILIDQGIIKDISDKNHGADKIIDAKENFVIPGLIDCHVHCREPGFTYKEDFYTASKAAAAGGITTFLDMPNNKPPTLTLDALRKKKKLAKKCVINYGFHFGSSKDNINDIKRVTKVASTKVYMGITTGDMVVEDKLEDIFRASKIVSAHAESDKVRKAIKLSKKTGKKLYLCHISKKEEIDYIRKNKDSNIFVEVTPHHLFLTEEDYRKMKGFAYMKPLLGKKSDQDALWKAVQEGIVDTICTDHAPHTINEKRSRNPPFGVPGLETMLPLLLNAVNKKQLALTQLVRLTSSNPARIFRIKNKGRIKVGYDADLVIINLSLTKKVKNNALFTKCRWSPFDNQKLQGWPVITIVNGNIVYDNGKFFQAKAKEAEYDEL